MKLNKVTVRLRCFAIFAVTASFVAVLNSTIAPGCENHMNTELVECSACTDSEAVQLSTEAEVEHVEEYVVGSTYFGVIYNSDKPQEEVGKGVEDIETPKVEPEPTVTAASLTSTESETPDYEYPEGSALTAYAGVYYNANGNKETYYNLKMSGVVNIMRGCGFSKEEHPYWVREDGVKMLGPYVMVAANLDTYPRGTTVYTSLGTGLVCDTGGFAANNPTQLDIAVSW